MRPKVKRLRWMWTLHRARTFCHWLEYKIGGRYHVAIAGSVLHKGKSNHDLDVIVYPRKTNRLAANKVHAAMKALGFERKFERDFILKIWRMNGSRDEKFVEGWVDAKGRRVDLFWLR